jgi:ribosomal protein S18 acetylase RimI-like enzyme
MLKGQELYQLYVSGRARGTGVASALIVDAERQLANRGFGVAWLDCAIGNHRAARFYEKSGWRRTGEVESKLTTREGIVSIMVWRYEKALR